MKKPTLIRDIMSKDIKTISPDATVMDAAVSMKENKIGALVVISNKALVGVITERDILNNVVVEGKVSSKILVKDIMTKNVISISGDLPYYEAISAMVSGSVKKIIIAEGKKPTGILTQTDILKFFAHKWADDLETD